MPLNRAGLNVGIQQIGTCAVYKRHGCYPAASCTRCAWTTETIYEDDLARQVAEHSQSHEECKTTVTSGTSINGIPISYAPNNRKGK